MPIYGHHVIKITWSKCEKTDGQMTRLTALQFYIATVSSIYFEFFLVRFEVYFTKGHSKNQFYFRWLENGIIEIGKAASIPLMFNHLN